MHWASSHRVQQSEDNIHLLAKCKPISERLDAGRCFTNRYQTFLGIRQWYTWNEVRKLGPGEVTWLLMELFANITNGIDYQYFLIKLQIRPLKQDQAIIGTEIRKCCASTNGFWCLWAFLLCNRSTVSSLSEKNNPKIECFTIDIRSSIKEGFVHDLPYATSGKHLKVSLNVVNVDEARFKRIACNGGAPRWAFTTAPLNVLYQSIGTRARHQSTPLELGRWSFYRISSWVLLMQEVYCLGCRNRYELDCVDKWLESEQVHFSAYVQQLLVLVNGDDRLINYFRWTQRLHLMKLYTQRFPWPLGVRAEDLMLALLSCHQTLTVWSECLP